MKEKKLKTPTTTLSPTWERPASLQMRQALITLKIPTILEETFEILK